MSTSSRSSISKARSYQEMGDFWDTHDLGDYWNQTRPADFEVQIESQVTYCPLDIVLAMQVRAMANQRGVSSETLVNLWVQDRLKAEAA